MNRITKIGAAAATLAGIALAGATAVSASATQPGRSAGPPATQTGPEPEDMWVDAFEASVKPWGGVDIPALTCPRYKGYLGGMQPRYLVNQVYSPGRAVPRGVQVLESGGVGVTIPGVQTGNSYGIVIGTSGTGATATNWGLSEVKLVIRLRCTADHDRGYLQP